MPDALSEKLGHAFHDPALLRRALTHASTDARASNERLEFLGDRVLGLIVAETLHARYPEADEGALTRRVHALVRWETCAKVGERIGLWDHLILSRDFSGGGGRSRGPLVGSACEAVIAALYLDGGMEAARAFVNRYWAEMFDDPGADTRDAKTRLQEWAQSGANQTRSAGAPVYVLKERTGPDHAPRFVVEARIEGLAPVTGEGGSKRQAEQAAAERLLAIVLPEKSAP
ncbi:MAG TPA: ribonuclease III [Rhizomicrobium sp.]|nr:ribonuclease III [Rhizomicrobium sp.]